MVLLLLLMRIMFRISLYLQKDDDSGTKNVEIIVPTKYVSNS